VRANDPDPKVWKQHDMSSPYQAVVVGRVLSA
jgi:hypothetical protein